MCFVCLFVFLFVFFFFFFFLFFVIQIWYECDDGNELNGVEWILIAKLPRATENR